MQLIPLTYRRSVDDCTTAGKLRAVVAEVADFGTSRGWDEEDNRFG